MPAICCTPSVFSSMLSSSHFHDRPCSFISRVGVMSPLLLPHTSPPKILPRPLLTSCVDNWLSSLLWLLESKFRRVPILPCSIWCMFNSPLAIINGCDAARVDSAAGMTFGLMSVHVAPFSCCFFTYRNQSLPFCCSSSPAFLSRVFVHYHPKHVRLSPTSLSRRPRITKIQSAQYVDTSWFFSEMLVFCSFISLSSISSLFFASPFCAHSTLRAIIVDVRASFLFWFLCISALSCIPVAFVNRLSSEYSSNLPSLRANAECKSLPNAARRNQRTIWHKVLNTIQRFHRWSCDIIFVFVHPTFVHVGIESEEAYNGLCRTSI